MLFRHPDDEPLDLREDAAPSWSRAVRPFPRDELSMPPQNRVGRDDRRQLLEATTAYPMPVKGQPTAFLIGQADPAAQVRAEDAVLFNQIRDGLLLLVGSPAGHGHHEESNRGDIHDRRSLHQRLRSRVRGLG
jgi:hypothetical protein